tara:strand:- start:3925 stop:4332 length:408 start_codon:yes stop_codon:yes gene_type:complete
MKLTNQQLKQIIREELQNTLREMEVEDSDSYQDQHGDTPLGKRKSVPHKTSKPDKTTSHQIYVAMAKGVESGNVGGAAAGIAHKFGGTPIEELEPLINNAYEQMDQMAKSRQHRAALEKFKQKFMPELQRAMSEH